MEKGLPGGPSIAKALGCRFLNVFLGCTTAVAVVSSLSCGEGRAYRALLEVRACGAEGKHGKATLSSMGREGARRAEDRR